MEILRWDAARFSQRDLAYLELYKNITEVHLRWLFNPSVKEILPMLKRCTHLRRLTLKSDVRHYYPSSEELLDFIMRLKHLTFFHIIYKDSPTCDHFKSEVDEVKAFVLPRRLNFKFYVSCCSKFDESRVGIMWPSTYYVTSEYGQFWPWP